MSSSRLRRGRHDWHVALSLRQWKDLVYHWQMRDGGGEESGVGGMGYHGRDWRREKIEYTKTGPDSDRGVFPSSFQNTRHVSGCKPVLQPPQLAEHFQLPSPTKESLAVALKLPPLPAHIQAPPHLLPSTHTYSLCLSLFSHSPAPATWPHLPGPISPASPHSVSAPRGEMEETGIIFRIPLIQDPPPPHRSHPLYPTSG